MLKYEDVVFYYPKNWWHHSNLLWKSEQLKERELNTFTLFDIKICTLLCYNNIVFLLGRVWRINQINPPNDYIIHEASLKLSIICHFDKQPNPLFDIARS